MLVLTRKPEEKIVIGDENDDIVITILKVQGGKVSIGIQADKKWQIVRKELLDGDREKKGKTATTEKYLPEGDGDAAATLEEMELIGAQNS